MSRTIKKATTSQSLYFEILDSTSNTGGRKTGLAYNTAGLTAYYVRNGGAATAITLATLAAANSAWSSGGFKEVDATNMPGIYRLDIPDLSIYYGAESVVFTLKGASGMVQVSSEVQFIDVAVSDVYYQLGLPVGADLSADIQAIKALVNLIPGTKDGKTFAERFTLISAVILGKASGLGTTTAVFRALDDSKDRITATVDANGNRSAVTLDAT